MANEIMILGGNDVQQYSAFFFYSIQTPYNTAAGGTLILTPSTGLPAIVNNNIDAAWQNDLNSGIAAFEQVSLRLPKSLTTAAAVGFLRSVYSVYRAAFEERYVAQNRYLTVKVSSS